MQRNHKIILVILGGIIAVFSVISYQWFLGAIAIGFIVLLLIISDLRNWVVAYVDRSPPCGKNAGIDPEDLNNSLRCIREELAGIEKRLESLEKK